MANVIGEFVAKIGADMKGFNTGLSSAEKRMGGFASGIAKHRKAIGVGMTAMGGAIVGALGMATKKAADFEAGMREVNTMMGLGQTEFEALSEDVLDLAKNLGVDAVESTKALYQAISAGVPKENVLTFMEIATKAAIGGVTDTETAVDGLTTVMNAFKIPMSDAQKVADIMFTTVKGGKTTFEELSSKMFNVAPIAASMGIAFEEVSAAIATMTKQGFPTAQATTAIRQAMVALQKPTKEMAEVIASMGYESGQAMVDALGFGGALDALRTATGGNNEMLMKMVGSVEAGGAVLALTGMNAETFTADLLAMTTASDGAGASQEAFNEIERGAARQFEKAKESISALVIEIGGNLLPVMTPLIERVGEVVGKVSAWIEENPELAATIAKVAGVVGVALLVLGPLLLILPGITAAVGLLGTAMTLALGPVGLIILAIGALIAIGVILWKNWDQLASETKKYWDAIVGYFVGVWTSIQTIFNGIAKAIWEPVKRAIQWVIDYIEKLMATIRRLWGMFGGRGGGGGGGGGAAAGATAGGASREAQGPTAPKMGVAYEPGMPTTTPGYFGEFHGGGIVPGPIGRPGFALVRGGETILPPGAGGGITINFREPVFMEREESMNALADRIYRLIETRQRTAFGEAYRG